MSAKKAEEPKKADDTKKGGFGGWLSDILEPLVIVAVDRAVADLRDDIDRTVENVRADIKAEMKSMETNLLGQFTQLPGMVASQVENVALDAEQVAEKVAGRFESFLNPQGLAQDVADKTGGLLGGILNPGAIAQQVIDGILPHFPRIPGF
jgi:hypothetical protein